MSDSTVGRIDATLRRAKLGDPRSQYELGWIYVQAGDFIDAYRWLALALDGRVDDAIDATEYLESAEHVSFEDIRDAYFEIGLWSEAGAMVPRDIPAAVRFWEVADAMGHPLAAAKLYGYVGR